MIDHIAAAIHGIRSDILAIVNHIKQTDKIRQDDQGYLIKTLSEQKETNRILLERIKALE